MKIYLDNCCFNRPFDDQSQIRIKLETEAKLKIQNDIIEKKFDLVWSYILEAENKANPFEERMKAIADWKQQTVAEVKENKSMIRQRNLRKSDCAVRMLYIFHVQYLQSVSVS